MAPRPRRVIERWTEKESNHPDRSRPTGRAHRHVRREPSGVATLFTGHFRARVAERVLPSHFPAYGSQLHAEIERLFPADKISQVADAVLENEVHAVRYRKVYRGAVRWWLLYVLRTFDDVTRTHQHQLVVLTITPPGYVHTRNRGYARVL